VFFEKTIGHGFLKFTNFKKLVDANPWIKNIEISNWGEIFLNPELKDIVKYSRARNVNLHAHSGSNLNTISEDMLEALVKYRLQNLTVSLDGASDETYSMYRIGGNFNKVIENIKKINHYKHKYDSDFPQLTWQFVIFGHNEHEIPAAKKMAKDLGMSFSPSLNAQFWDPPFSPVKNKDFIIKETGLEFATREEFEEKYKINYHNTCPQLWMTPQINWNGDLLGCCWNMFSDYGNVFTSGLTECLKSKKYISSKKTLLGLEKPKEDIPCFKCSCFDKRSISRIRKAVGMLAIIDRFSSTK